MRKLDNWLDTYIEYTKESEVTEIFRLWVGISTIASCLQRKCWSKLGSLITYPNMYIILVGPPASKKGTAIMQGRDLLNDIGVSIAPDYSSKEALIEELATSNDRFVENDGNWIEHSSISIISRELGVLFGNKRDLGMIPYLCDVYDCHDEFRSKTIGRGDRVINNVWANLIGATIPDFKNNLPPEVITGGFSSRSIFVYSEGITKPEDLVIVPQLNPEVRDILSYDLEQILNLSGEYSYDEEFISSYGKWRMDNFGFIPGDNPKLKAYADRRSTHARKLSIILCASRTNDNIVKEEDFVVAAEIISETEKDMSLVFGGIGKNPFAEVQEKIISLVFTKGEISYSELLEQFRLDISANDLSEIIKTLIVAKLCKIELKEGVKKLVAIKKAE